MYIKYINWLLFKLVKLRSKTLRAHQTGVRFAAAVTRKCARDSLKVQVFKHACEQIF